MNNTLQSNTRECEEKFLVDLTSLRKKLKESFDEINKDLQESKASLAWINRKQTTDTNSIKELLLASKDSIKSELSAKYIKPELEVIKLEQGEMGKTLAALEKQIKILYMRFEKFEEKAQSTLETHRDDIKRNEVDLSGINRRFEGIVESKTENLMETIKAFDRRIEETYEAFNLHKEDLFKDIYQKEERLKDVYGAKAKYIEEQKNKIISTVESVYKSHAELINKVEQLDKHLQFELERLKIENEGYSMNCYKDAKAQLIKAYKEDISSIKKKLEWLPDDLGTLQDMNSIEARLYTLESRLKVEETNRIVQRLEIMRGNLYVEIEEKGHSLSTQHRSITPTSFLAVNPNIKFPSHTFKHRKLKYKTPEAKSTIPYTIKYPFN